MICRKECVLNYIGRRGGRGVRWYYDNSRSQGSILPRGITMSIVLYLTFSRTGKTSGLHHTTWDHHVYNPLPYFSRIGKCSGFCLTSSRSPWLQASTLPFSNWHGLESPYFISWIGMKSGFRLTSLGLAWSRVSIFLSRIGINPGFFLPLCDRHEILPLCDTATCLCIAFLESARPYIFILPTCDRHDSIFILPVCDRHGLRFSSFPFANSSEASLKQLQLPITCEILQNCWHA